jgi:hypothetical protein
MSIYLYCYTHNGRCMPFLFYQLFPDRQQKKYYLKYSYIYRSYFLIHFKLSLWTLLATPLSLHDQFLPFFYIFIFLLYF